MWDTSHVPGWVHGRSCSDSTHILSVILPWTESQCYLELSSAFVLCQAALPNKSSFQMLPYHENFNTNGEENRVQSARLQFHSDDSDFRCVRQKTGGTLYFFYSVVYASSRCNLHLHVRTRFCSTSCIWRGTDWVHGDSWLKSPSLWLEEPKPIWTRFLKSEDVIRVSGIQILCCAESNFARWIKKHSSFRWNHRRAENNVVLFFSFMWTHWVRFYSSHLDIPNKKLLREISDVQLLLRIFIQ